MSSTTSTTDSLGKAAESCAAPTGDGIARTDFLDPLPRARGGDQGRCGSYSAGHLGVEFKHSSSIKPIVITGQGATISGESGTRVEGRTTGFDVGQRWSESSVPGSVEMHRCLGSTTTPLEGDFSWQFKTAKRTHVFFTIGAGDVKSNRVITPASQGTQGIECLHP